MNIELGYTYLLKEKKVKQQVWVGVIGLQKETLGAAHERDTSGTCGRAAVKAPVTQSAGGAAQEVVARAKGINH